MDDYGGWMWLIVAVTLLAIPAAAIIHGVDMWRRHHGDPATRETHDEETQRLYHRQI